MKQKKDRIRQPTGPMTADETARIIKEISKLYEIPGAGNHRVAVALKKAATLIADLGDQPISKISKGDLYGRENHALPVQDFSNLSINDVRAILSDPQATKTRLIEMALVRFGMPKSRLTKLPFEEAVDAIMAAAANEESLEIIAKNADQSGRERQS